MALTSLTNEDNIRILTLDAPARLNALDQQMLVEISDHVEIVKQDPDARALVVTGAGRGFCAGADLASLFADVSRPTWEMRDQLRSTYARFLTLKDLSIPTISAVNGVAVGAGINIALACDIVVVGPDAEFAVTFAEIGLHPGGGCSWFLTRRLGPGRALQVVLGAARISGKDAVASGLAETFAEDPFAEAMEQARQYATLDPDLVRDATHAIRLSAGAGLDEVLQYEAWAQAASVARPVFQNYLAAFQERRAARVG
jgi:enoyl-CoA hydratase